LQNDARRIAMRALFAQVAYRLGWPGFWIFLGVMIAALVVILYLFFRSQPPPGGPRIGE
jgi:hypothetical protein